MIEYEGLANLDGMDESELWDFWSQTNSVRPIKRARELFPDCPKDYVRTTKDLGHYACNTAVARKLRREGQIARALDYERIADGIYASLPDYAKW